MKLRLPTKWVKLFFAVIVVVALVVTPVLYLELRAATPPAYKWLAVRGFVTNATTPLFNVSLVAVTNNENFYKGFTDKWGFFEILAPFPSNRSAPIYCIAFKTGYEVMQKQAPLPLLKIVKYKANDVIWGYVNFNFTLTVVI